MNILISSIGRRVALANCFRQVLMEINLKGSVIGVDLTDIAPAYHVTDRSYRVCRISDSEYIPQLLNICRKEEISLMFSVLDSDLLKLSQAKQQFTDIGTYVMISSPEVISICRDKFRTHGFFVSAGVPTPRLYRTADFPNEIEFPLYIKPSNGSASVNSFKISNWEEYVFFRSYVQDPMLLEFIEGEEYTCDIYIDSVGDVRGIVPRRRLEVRAGEVSKARIEMNPAVIEPTRKVAKALAERGATGVLNIQCILSPEGHAYFIEINPRFGGGCPLSIKAGYNFPKWIIQEMLGQEINTQIDDGDGLTMLRYDEAVFVNNGKRV